MFGRDEYQATWFISIAMQLLGTKPLFVTEPRYLPADSTSQPTRAVWKISRFQSKPRTTIYKPASVSPFLAELWIAVVAHLHRHNSWLSCSKKPNRPIETNRSSSVYTQRSSLCLFKPQKDIRLREASYRQRDSKGTTTFCKRTNKTSFHLQQFNDFTIYFP